MANKIIIKHVLVTRVRKNQFPGGQQIMRQAEMHRPWIRLNVLVLLLMAVPMANLQSEDWPMWRHDAGRSAASSETLASDLALRWTRQLVAPRMAWPEDPRIHFDATLEPVSTGSQVFIASSTTDSVTALDANTGLVRWQVFADGPIRFAPVVAHQQVYFGADDGYIYCVS
ncbi:MAG: PQQ-binding-like beta-propeller repeat protein, partial [Pirellulaceae bacterium]|nr:PQQ-binding-like beta-propeller repeat protein [Pirellulaceae bacterium]